MTQKMELKEEKRDGGNQSQGELTRERGGTTVEATDRENGLKKEKGRKAGTKDRVNYNLFFPV